MTTTLVAPRDGKKVEGVPTSGLMLLIGHPKSGKTTLAAKFPGAYVLELEMNGGDRIEGSGLRIQDIRDEVSDDGVVVKTALDQFGDILELCIQESTIKTIVVDTIDELAELVGADILKSMGRDPKDTKPQDKNYVYWNELRNRVAALCDYLKASGKLVIMVAHCKAPEKSDTGQIITPAGINVPGKGGAYIAAQAEMIGYVSKRVIGGKMVQYLSFNAPSDLAIWGSRLEELDGKEIMIPKADPYSAFAAMFVTQQAPKAPKLTPPAPLPAKKKK